MSDSDSLLSLYDASIRQIRKILGDELSPIELRVGEDFDRDGVILIGSHSGKRLFRLFVSHEVLSDIPSNRIPQHFQNHRVVEQLRKLPKGTTLFVTTGGTFQEQTEGATLREGTNVFEGVLPASEARSQLYDRVFAIRIDGVPLGDIPMEMRGDPALHTFYSDEFADALGAVYLLDAAGYRDFSLEREALVNNHRVDFIVHLQDGEHAFLEFKRAFNKRQREADSLREQINVGLRRALQDESIRKAVEGRFIDIQMPRPPRSRKEAILAIDEVIRFVTSTDWATVRERDFAAFEASRFPVLADLSARSYVVKGPTHLSVQEGAKAFDPYEPFREVARVVAEASIAAPAVHPLWLGVSLADSSIVLAPSDVLDERRLATFDIHRTPFDQIIVGAAGNAKRYTKK